MNLGSSNEQPSVNLVRVSHGIGKLHEFTILFIVIRFVRPFGDTHNKIKE